ncbi:MAG: AAA family ATPase, partial [Planctomycetales bacterium]|nr:AAA family ATPase [Planctomycetales bacterium]
MTAPLLSTRRQLELMRDLQRLARERHAEEERLAAAYSTGVRDAERKRRKIREPALEQYDEDIASANEVDAAQREAQAEDHKRLTSALQREYRRTRDELAAKRTAAKESARKKLSDGSWQIHSVYDAKKDQPGQRRQDVDTELSQRSGHLGDTQVAAKEVFSGRLLALKPTEVEPVEVSPDSIPPEQATDAQIDSLLIAIKEDAEHARETTQRMYDAWLSRVFETGFFAALLLALAVLTVPVVLFSLGIEPLARNLTIGGGASLIVATTAGLLLWLAVRPIARRITSGRYQEILELLRRATRHIAEASATAEVRAERQARELVEQRDKDLKELNDRVQREFNALKQKIDAEREKIDREYPERLKDARDQNTAAIQRLEDELEQTLTGLARKRDRTIDDCELECAQTKERLLSERDAAYDAMRAKWLDGCQRISGEFARMRAECQRLFPDWSSTDFNAWDKPADPSLAVEFGRARLDLAAIKHGLSEDERLKPAETVIEIPTLVTLTEQPAMFIAAEGAAKKQGADLLQAVTLRFLTGQPPGKVRLTLLDPSGLGEGLSPFMHLADYEEDLIAKRIWSETRDIDEQLQRLTAHMETVIQKYLRSEYDDIHAYNQQAGEVAEPFHVVVVNGFPNNFTDTAAKRLVSLATGGPRCGVYVLAVIDAAYRLPTDFRVDELKADAVNLEWDAQRARLVWRYPGFELLPLTVAQPPEPERMVEVVRKAGAAAKDAVRVEVPFSVVAPQDDYWAMSCSDELLVPVGRAGANRLQDVRLGKGTSQHLLVAGKTGSGKSTFLHALVTSAALHYSPDELEFYLVDFKKGVEFKSYVTNRLPHARVIAIESEREFGLSVLERLDRELTRRGELYRASGVQNLADFRAMHPDTPMPRVLLVIDEFQELFVEDDRLAQEATLLMDRLVRQGRAFGVHVILGTQTLAGAYSIARSTLGQIAIRVALACSEADAHLILADERNQAARFLSRPGEAIYNDQ